MRGISHFLLGTVEVAWEESEAGLGPKAVRYRTGK